MQRYGSILYQKFKFSARTFSPILPSKFQFSSRFASTHRSKSTFNRAWGIDEDAVEDVRSKPLLLLICNWNTPSFLPTLAVMTDVIVIMVVNRQLIWSILPINDNTVSLGSKSVVTNLWNKKNTLYCYIRQHWYTMSIEYLKLPQT